MSQTDRIANNSSVTRAPNAKALIRDMTGILEPPVYVDGALLKTRAFVNRLALS